jgi:hypothetical protein
LVAAVRVYNPNFTAAIEEALADWLAKQARRRTTRPNAARPTS